MVLGAGGRLGVCPRATVPGGLPVCLVALDSRIDLGKGVGGLAGCVARLGTFLAESLAGGRVLFVGSLVGLFLFSRGLAGSFFLRGLLLGSLLGGGLASGFFVGGLFPGGSLAGLASSFFLGGFLPGGGLAGSLSCVGLLFC